MHIPKENKKQIKNAGIMLMELLIGVLIIIILSGVVAVSFSSYSREQALENSAGNVEALFSEARSRTMNGDGGLSYGVHLESTQVVLFSGDTYADGAPGNKVVSLDPSVEIDSISLSGDGSDVMFDPVTGNTEEDGTFVIQKIATTVGAQLLTVTHAGQISSSAGGGIPFAPEAPGEAPSSPGSGSSPSGGKQQSPDQQKDQQNVGSGANAGLQKQLSP